MAYPTRLLFRAPLNLQRFLHCHKTLTISATDSGDSADKLDQLLLSASICNGEDLGPFVRKAFASGKPETLLHHLRHFSKSKEAEIEDVYRAHYQDFIIAVDDLRSLLSDVDSSKTSISLNPSRECVQEALQHLFSLSVSLSLKTEQLCWMMMVQLLFACSLAYYVPFSRKTQ
ncbi:hypothetical protein CsSME_00003972 [Camellia sinensis var. sinensis]